MFARLMLFVCLSLSAVLGCSSSAQKEDQPAPAPVATIEVVVPPVVQAITAALAVNLPPAHPIEVRFPAAADMTWPGVFGATWMDWQRGVIVIEVMGDLCVPSMIDTLIHEWAHALRWDTAGCDDSHDEVWGVLFSRCYREAVRAMRAWADQ